MGGTSTGCSEATTDVFIESAWFDPDPHRPDRARHRHHLRRPVPLRPRRRPAIPGSRPRAGHAADPGAVRRRAVRDRVRRRGARRRRRPSPSIRPMWASFPAWTISADRVWTILGDSGIRARRRSGPAAVVAPDVERQGRPGRGGRADRRLRRPAGHAAAAKRRGPSAACSPRARPGSASAAAPWRPLGYQEAITWSFIAQADRDPVRRRRPRRWCCTTPSRPTSTACGPRSCRA